MRDSLGRFFLLRKNTRLKCYPNQRLFQTPRTVKEGKTINFVPYEEGDENYCLLDLPAEGLVGTRSTKFIMLSF